MAAPQSLPPSRCGRVKYFGTTPELWLNLQADYDLRRARATDWPKIEPRVRVLAAGR